MLLEHVNLSDQEINEKTTSGRLEELLNQYEDSVRATVHMALESFVEKAFQEFMNGRTGEVIPRESDRVEIKDYRNGYRTVKQQMIDTLVLKNFKIPRNRAGGFRPEILQRTKRRAGRFAQLALELFVNGISTRKARRAFERAGVKISGLSKSTVSDISKDLLKEYVKWINRPITREFSYLQVDAVYIRVRKGSNRRVGTLMVIGIAPDGYKEVLHFTLGSESRNNFDEVLQSLIKRGLKTESVKLVTTDGAKGPINSIVSHFGIKKLQRCTVHKGRNILEKCPGNLKDELKAKLGRLWNMPSLFEAEEYLEKLKSEYSQIAQNSIDCLLEDKDDLLRFFNFPDEHRKTIRNTNLIERVIREVRRRTKVMDSLDNEYGCYGIVMGTVREQNYRWSKKSHWKKN